jgi:hypothetical protein
MRRSIVSAAVLAAGVLTGCATTAPDDIWESLDQQWLRDTPYGIVKSVTTVAWDGKSYDAFRTGYTPSTAKQAAYAPAINDIGNYLRAEKRYVHEIVLASGETVKETSVYQFPVGSCVSLGANQTRHPGRMAFSKRCSATAAH